MRRKKEAVLLRFPALKHPPLFPIEGLAEKIEEWREY